MELLAPAGNVENFYAALEAGADAVYVGAPGFNARNLARDLRLKEIGAMIAHCHAEGKKIYIAANSLILEKELPEVVETLAILEDLQPDALIVQDLGLINLIRRFFPRLTLHASTLMAAHNLQCVELFARLGCERVVLARELTLAEIEAIAAKTQVELEVFVHGAMCFSYSGLCLFSSYLGGKSGLRGRCVQPCRRAYANQPKRFKGERPTAKGSYLFSMNDLEGLEVVGDLRRAGVSSLKVEGRLRSARYVEKVISAYRLLIDADPDEQEGAMAEARERVIQAMSRKVSPGYFFTPYPQEAISPYHSGNMGLHLGRSAERGKKNGKQLLKLQLKESLSEGDRLRLHFEPSGERIAYTLKELFVRTAAADMAGPGEAVDFVLPDEASSLNWKYVDVYKVDVAGGRGDTASRLQTDEVSRAISAFRRKNSTYIKDIQWKVWESGHHIDPASAESAPKRKGPKRQQSKKRGAGAAKLPLEWWLKVDSVKPLLARMPFHPERYVIVLNRNTYKEAGQLKRLLGKRIRNVTWALSPILMDREIGRLRKQISMLLRTGFRSFQLSHISQIDLFEGEKVFLSADYPLNLLNNQSLLMAAEAGFESAQLAIEADREAISAAVQGYKQTGIPAAKRMGGRRDMRLGLTVYGAPPLFTSRISANFFQFGKPIVSPKNESFVIRKGDGFTQTHPLRPFSLLPYLYELKGLGLDFVVADLTGGRSGKKDIEELADRIAGAGRQSKLPTFNYLGRLE